MALEQLFSPFSIGNLKLKNRIVMPPMATNYATSEGFVSDRQIAYYIERARGGVGYITVEHTGIHEHGKASPKMLMISTDEQAAKIEKLAEAVHTAGGKIVVQINHAGRRGSDQSRRPADVFKSDGGSHCWAFGRTRFTGDGNAPRAERQ
jgi:2,4-dienoyl-CoA reductase-like NADH-dependent reductase (Old Yellow Enzyme family)